MKAQFLTLFSQDVEKTVSAYRSLGLEFFPDQHGGPVHYVHAGEAVAIEIYPKADAGASEDIMIGFEVSSLEQMRERAVQASIPIFRDIATVGGFRRLILKDPDGRRLFLREFSER